MDGETLRINLNSSAAKLTESDTDAELVNAVLAGDEAAFNVIFDRYRKLVVHLVGRFFNRREIVEDLSQQAFTKIYFSLKDFRGENEKSFSSWLSRLTVNLCYDELRRNKRRPENLFAELSSDEFEFAGQIEETGASGIETGFEDRDLAKKLLTRLGAEDRMVVTLFYGYENSVSEVADLTGWSESKVKTRLMRTRNLLRKFVKGLS